MLAILTGLMLTCGAALSAADPPADDVPDPFREYKGKEPVTDGLRETFTGFVRSARGGSVEGYLLPHSVKTTREPRPKDSRDYGEDINEDFLKNGFSPLVRTVRKDGDDCYLIRTGSTAIWFVQNKDRKSTRLNSSH